jgi:hypothetical protein
MDRRSTRRARASAVELVDRTMIDLARGNPAFRPVIERALIGEPEAILLVEFTGDDARDARAARRSRRAAGRPRPAGSVVQMTEPPRRRRCGTCARPGSTS